VVEKEQVALLEEEDCVWPEVSVDLMELVRLEPRVSRSTGGVWAAPLLGP